MKRAAIRVTCSVILLCGATMVAGASAAGPPCILTVADTMEKVFRDEPSDRPPAQRLVIEAARNEVEGIQLIVAPPGKEDLRAATLEVADLEGDAGVSIPKANVTWNVVGYVQTEAPNYPVRKVGWWPDPLLPDRRFDVKAGQVQPLWINVRVPADAKAGTYRGNVTVRLSDGQSYSVPLEVRAWNFTIPKQQHLETCFPLRPGEFQQFYKLRKLPVEMYEQWIDFCLAHRISINLCDWPDFNRDMERLAARQLDGGGSAFCLSYAWFTQGKPEDRQKHNAQITGQIKRLYDRAKSRGWIDRAYIYCHDEISKEQYPFAKELYGDLKKAMPDLRLMQTFYKDDPIPALDRVLDIWAPNTARYRPAEFQAQQAKGDGVWWYVCCGPGKPFANLMIEWPAIDHRLLLWQNWKYHVGGFLYWGLNVWRDNVQGDRRWPEVPWNPATFRNDAGKAHNGDGQLIYPGPDRAPLSSIRLENLRDGIEDYEYFWLLRDGVVRLKQRGAAKHQALIAEAEKALSVDEGVAKDLTHFTQDPRSLRRARATLAALIERADAAEKTGTGSGPPRANSGKSASGEVPVPVFSQRLDPAQLARIRPAMQGFVDRGEIAGAVALVGRRDRVASVEAVGYQDLEKKIPMRPDSLFRIASMTKPVTAVGIMILVDEGKLSVEDPVEKYIPEFGDLRLKAGVKDGSLRKPARPITIRDLLTHTSGLPGGLPPALADLYVKRDRSLAEGVKLFAREPLEFEPGTKWAYCNIGIDTLGRIIEVASGQPYETFLKNRVFEPLGMVDTCFYPTVEQRQRIAVTYGVEKGKLVPSKGDIIALPQGAKYPIPAGGLYSTAGDLARFYQMMLHHGTLGGKRILSPGSVRTMTQVQTGELTSGFTPGMGFGFGWAVVRKPEGVTAMLSKGSFGHGGAFGTQGWIDPEKDLIMVLMIQRIGLPNADASAMRRELQTIAVSALGK